MNHKRHLGIYDASNLDVTLIGVGGIGSMAALVLSKMGVRSLTLIDFDDVSDENISTQFYRLRDVGIPKVYALGDILGGFSDALTFSLHSDVGCVWEEYLSAKIVISAVDSIEIRKEIWKILQNVNWKWYIDARMGAEYFMMYTTYKGREDDYARSLSEQEDGQIPDDPCTSKATFYTAAMAAGHIGSAVRDISKGIVPPLLTIHNIPERCLVVVPRSGFV